MPYQTNEPDLGNPQLTLCIGLRRLSDLLSVLYNVFSRLSHNMMIVALPSTMIKQCYGMGFKAYSQNNKKQKKFHFPTTQNEIFMYNREVGENRNSFYKQPACKET